MVLLSHDQHADNLDVAGRAMLASVHDGPVDPGRRRADRGRARPRALGAATVGAVTVTAVPARHGPEGAEPLSGVVTGFVLQADGWPTVYVSGDNASLDVVDAIVRRVPAAIDLAVLFVGGANVGRFGAEPLTLDAARASAAADLLLAARIVPVHHTDWAHFVEPLTAVEERFAANGRRDRLVVLERGRPTEL